MHSHWDEHNHHAHGEVDVDESYTYESAEPSMQARGYLQHSSDSVLTGREPVWGSQELRSARYSPSYRFADRVKPRLEVENSYRAAAKWYLSSFQASSSRETNFRQESEVPKIDIDGGNRYMDTTQSSEIHRLPTSRAGQASSCVGRLPSLFGRKGFLAAPRTPPNINTQDGALTPPLRFVREEFKDQMSRSRYDSDGHSPCFSGSDRYPTPPGEPRQLYDTEQELLEGPDVVHASERHQPEKKKRKVRLCKTIGCDKLVVDHGVCIRHGGGKRCNVAGCESRSQNRGLCWKHGGYTICEVEACGKRAKSRGMCWSHGGGTRCKTLNCTKIAVSRGHCWAHGGGKRCKIPECQKPASLRLNDFCSEHHGQDRLKSAKQPRWQPRDTASYQ